MYIVKRKPIIISTSFLPSDIANLAIWYEADLIGGSDGDPVTTWTDSSGNGNSSTQGTSNQKPLHKTNIVNSLPVVRFDGSNDWLKSNSINFSSTTFTIFVVCTNSSTANGDVFCVDDGSGNTFAEMRVDSDVRLTFSVKNTGGSTFECNVGQSSSFQVMCGVKSSTSIQAFINGTAGSSTSVSGTQRTGTSNANIGQFGLGFQYFGGDIAEVLYYADDIGSTNREAVEDYLGTKYDIIIS